MNRIYQESIFAQTLLSKKDRREKMRDTIKSEYGDYFWILQKK